MYLGMKVLICMPLSKRAIQFSPLILTLATFWPHANIERSLLGWLYTLETSVLRFFGVVAIVRVVQAAFINAISSLSFNSGFSLKVLHKQTILDKMFWATTVIAVLLLCLGILYSPCQAHHKFFSQTMNSIGSSLPSSLSPLVPSSSKCAKGTDGAFGMGWWPLNLHRWKKLVAHGFGVISVMWVLGLWESSKESSFSIFWVALE